MSDCQRHAAISALFAQALEQPEGEARERWLIAACGDDAEALRELRELLAAYAQADGFLETPPHAEAQALLGDRLMHLMIGRRLGAWRIDRPIHSGGMGAVYLAHRAAGDFEQQAALKIVRGEIAHGGGLERFARERQLLARLEHPNIARLLDGGTTDDGLPWLVMEYVPGRPIDRWADDQALGLHARLKLFEQVCEAVHYAHRHLVVHRDIKPGNILVTPDGVPKLLDFGIAKLLRPETELATELTVTRHRALTPGYASPEQITGAPVTTASDVYSLGVLLYRLLTGRMPLELDGASSLLEVERLIVQRSAVLPSDSLLERGGHGLPRIGRLNAPQLRRALRGDLDTIVMTALRKEPERRFESVAAFADDLRRYREGLPVRARPDTLGYRTRKFARRHWKGLGGVGAAFAALVAGLAVALWQAEAARAERDRAEQISNFLQDILVEADPYEAGAEATVRDVLRKADEMIAQRFEADPALEAALRYTVGYTQLSLMQLDRAERNLLAAGRLNLALYGDDDARSLWTQLQLASLAYEKGDIDASEAGYREAIARLRPEHPPALRAAAYNDFGVVLLNWGRSREALEHFRRAAAMQSDAPVLDRANTLNNIGHAYHNLGELEAAERHYRRALDLLRPLYPDGLHPDLASAVNNLGVLLYELGRHEEALASYRESLEIRRATLGETHPRTGAGYLNLGLLLTDLARFEEARPPLEQALELSREGLGEERLQTLLARGAVARLAAFEGDAARAEAELASVRAQLVRIGAAQEHVEKIDRWLDQAGASH